MGRSTEAGKRARLKGANKVESVIRRVGWMGWMG